MIVREGPSLDGQEIRPVKYEVRELSQREVIVACASINEF